MTRRAALLAVGALVPGCQLLLRTDSPDAEEVAQRLLKPIPTLKDGIRLDVFRVDRAIGDPRIGVALWNQLSEGGSLSPEGRQLLGQNGFRLGTSPASPPLGLQELILSKGGIATDRTLHQSFDFPAGNHATLDLLSLPEGTTLDVPGPDGIKHLTLNSARCVLRIRPERIEEGWARLECQPEIHHGDVRTRPVATDQQWLMQQSQDVEPLFHLRFTVELNRGELAVLGANDRGDQTLGRTFFRNQIETPFERLLVIRLADVFTVTASGAT